MTGEMQARPMAEVLEAFRRRVVLTGGNEEEHCSLYELAHLREVNAELVAALQGQVESDGCIVACGNGSDDPEECSPACAKVRAALSKVGAK